MLVNETVYSDGLTALSSMSNKLMDTVTALEETMLSDKTDSPVPSHNR